MRIKELREQTVRLDGDIANSSVNFAEHTVSVVAVISDVVRGGRPVVGVAFDSIGRFGQGGILRERVFPRLMAAEPGELLAETGDRFDPAAVARIAARNEKPGGHGDRAAAIAAVELAFWDLNAKLADEPAYRQIAQHFARPLPSTVDVDVYAAGGYYVPGEGTARIAEEFRRYQDLGFTAFKMKIGGAPLVEDQARIEAALTVAGSGDKLAVDANGRFDIDTALRYAEAIAPYQLRWYEEPGDPLDYRLNRRITAAGALPVATGENLFSIADVRNLVRHGGMRPGRDIFQMDAGLSYGLVEYAEMLTVLEEHGFDRGQAHPHGGHLINLHIVAGLGLGGCEAYPGVFQPFGGYPAGCLLGAGKVRPTEEPGFGLETKPGLREVLAELRAP
ncbi:mandelate racemase [Saccharopolyspora sp. K220]|uniref:enolase C-terminal domain-like protein n=1 Tax=Saccharopolyspora soli TaxID=2926618 RepID=UPI001F574498|nr:enolase C-terminal domain-like protein [Saccharopolyspora soli]MCI2421756.1 mandelate racemase [Saccharopolyspora soli]